MKDNIYYRQANLLTTLLPYINDRQSFALKGGTAINFFFRSLPRLSVDIDLTYLPIEDRQTSLPKISNNLLKISNNIQNDFPYFRITEKKINKSNNVKGLIIRDNKRNASVKIECNIILRGSVYTAEEVYFTQEVINIFEKEIGIISLPFADLFGGKICAALDRQHPRDLFDVHLLLKNEGLTDEIRKAFIAYLLSCPRPVIELLNPNFKDISQTYENEFKEMTRIEISLAELLRIREKLVNTINDDLTRDERRFIVSVIDNAPEWGLLNIPHVKNLPAIKWKMLNLQKMDSKRHNKLVERLKVYLEV